VIAILEDEAIVELMTSNGDELKVAKQLFVDQIGNIDTVELPCKVVAKRRDAQALISSIRLS
jgi:hypothetical protein